MAECKALTGSAASFKIFELLIIKLNYKNLICNAYVCMDKEKRVWWRMLWKKK